MPGFDRKSGEVVMRIVFDGSPEAGKTTTIDYLASAISLQRRSPVTRPGTTERRTEFFDWLDFAGGFVDGHRVRCQLVSVPGQSSLLHRRRYLLDSADAVVFVADATADRLDEVRGDFLTTRRIIEKQGTATPVGVVLQVNKQDMPGALSPLEVATALGLTAPIPIVGTSANVGTGVMQTLILAVRLATDRVRSIILERELDQLRQQDGQPEELHRAMLALEPSLPLESSARAGEDDLAAPQTPGAYWRKLCASQDRPNVAPLAQPLLPQATTLPAGCIWPAVSGRAALAAANQAKVEAPAWVSDFAPAEAFELQSDNGWLFHSRPAWLFATESEARLALLTIARSLAESADLLPEGRALLSGPADGGWRLWMVTRRTVRISELIGNALDSGDAPTLAQTWIAVAEFARARTLMSKLATQAPLSALAAQRGRMVVLTLPEHDLASPQSSSDLAEDLVRRLELVRGASPEAAPTVDAARALVREHESRSRKEHRH